MRQIELIELEILQSALFTPDDVAKHNGCILLVIRVWEMERFINISKWFGLVRNKKVRTFFSYEKKVDWIIGNPPYSIFEEWLRHSFEIADEVAYILPTNKVFQRQVIMKMINEYGGIKGIIIYGSGSTVGFPFGFSVGTFHFSKGHKGPTYLRLGNT